MQYYLVVAIILHVTTIISLLSVFGVSLVSYMEDLSWNRNLTAMGPINRRSIMLNPSSDLVFSLVREDQGQSNDEALFRKALKSSDLRKIVGRKGAFHELGIRQTMQQIMFTVIVGIMAITSITLLAFLCRYNSVKWRAKYNSIYHLVGVLILLIFYFLYIGTMLKADRNYKEMGSRIRQVTLEIGDLDDSESIPETFHNCQLRSMGLPREEEVDADLEARRICHSKSYKITVVIVTFACIIFFTAIPCYVCCCLRRKLHEGREFYEPEGTENRLDPGSRRAAREWPLITAPVPSPINPEAGSREGSDTDLPGEVLPYSSDSKPHTPNPMSPEIVVANA